MNWMLLIQLLPALEEAINLIVKAENVTPQVAATKLVDHITPGQPEAPALK